MKQNTNSQKDSNINQSQQKNIKDMTLEEQVNYYKTMFQKSRTLSKFYDGEIKKLKQSLSNYECQDGEECELIMKFKYDKDIFYLFKDSKKKYFINEITLDKELIKQLKNHPSIKLYDYEKDLKNKDDYLTQIIKQYEEKLKNLNTENENLKNKLKELRNNQIKFNKDSSNEKLLIENSIKTMIEKSNDL